MENNNIILTGIPRSGTTLACSLLNKLDDVVALHEPLNPAEFFEYREQGHLVDKLKDYFDETRKLINTKKSIHTKHINGAIPDNPFTNVLGGFGLRKSQIEYGKIKINKRLSEDFLLVVKHPALFTGILEELNENFRCYAVIRNPLSVLASWNSADLPVNKGHAYAAEQFDDKLKKNLSGIENRYERQIYILSWFCEKFLRILRKDQIIRYEDIIDSAGKALKVISKNANMLNEKLENKNKNVLYNYSEMRILGEKLLKEQGAFWEFYSKDSVKKLVETST